MLGTERRSERLDLGVEIVEQHFDSVRIRLIHDHLGAACGRGHQVKGPDLLLDPR